MSKSYVIKGKDKKYLNFLGYFSTVDEIRETKIIGFCPNLSFKEVRKYTTRKRCQDILKRLENINKLFEYEIEEIERG